MSDPNQTEEIVQIEDIQTFANVIMDWHQSKVALLEHMMEIPENTEVSINEGKSTLLEGDFHKGFILGLTISLMEMGTLPIVEIPAEADFA